MAIGREFGVYKLRRKIARGGMGEIFLASRKTEEGNKLCVIKMLLPSALTNPMAKQLFLGEARLSTQLHHENIVRILDRGKVDNYFFIAMEYIAGETFYRLMLQSEMTQKPLSPRFVSALMAQACDGLGYAHGLTNSWGQSQNLIHQDISPSNLMLSYSGQVKLLDFGVAVAESRKMNLPDGRFVGNYNYLSPEQCLGQTIDQRSDLFSLGIVFWELLTNSRLFSGTGLEEIAEIIKLCAIPRPSLVRRDLPRGIEAVVLKALSRSVKKRYQDAYSMKAAIEKNAGPLPSKAVVAQTMIELFGKRQSRLSRLGDIGQELNLEDLLFDDLGLASNPNTKNSPSTPNRSKKAD